MILTEERLTREALRVHAHLERARKAGLPATLTLEEWTATLEQYREMCAYCQNRPFEVLEHFFPINLGGGTTAENCVPACKHCNSHKGIRDAYRDTETGNIIVSQVPGKRRNKIRVIIEKPVYQKNYALDGQWLTPENIARWLIISDDLVYKWLKSGELFGLRKGKLWRIPKKAVDEFLIKRSNGSNQETEEMQ